MAIQKVKDYFKNYGKEKANHILLYETLIPF